MIKDVFLKVKIKFPEVNSKIIPFDKKSFMLSNPLTKNIYYNKEQYEKFKFSKKALIGVLAHELGHQVSYKNINFLQRLFFKYRYNRNFDFKRKAEREADIIAIKRGFGNELIELIKESERKFNHERFLKIKRTHLSINEIKRLMKSNHKNDGLY